MKTLSKKKLPAIVITVAVLILVGLMIRISMSSSKDVRNVILISIDTCRADHLGCYGYKLNTTPNIDNFARQACQFSNTITPVPVTLPAHSTMLTGTIPPYHGVHNNINFRLGESNLTLAEILQEAGFATAAFVGSMVLDSERGLDQGFETYDDNFKEPINSVLGVERRAGEVSSEALQWLRQNKKKRFFMFLHYYDPHTKYDPPEPFATKFTDNLYAGEIAYSDHCIGQVLAELKKLGLYDSSLIIITADHGEMLGEHGEKDHTYFIYNSAIKVPLLFKLPGQTKHITIDQIAGLVDIVPTVCGLLDIKIPADIHGQDLSPYLSKTSTSMPDRKLYCESLTPSRYNANGLLGIVTQHWKYIQTTRPELYDFINDPNESHNLINEQYHRGRIFEDNLKQILKKAVRTDKIDNQMKLNEAALKKLRGLGYVGGTEEAPDLQFDESRDDPKDLIEFHNDFHTALELMQQKKYTQAREICEMLISQRPEFFESYLTIATSYMEQKNFVSAIPALKKTIAVKPDVYDAYNKLGVCLSESGRLDEAIQHYNKAVQLRPDKPKPYSNLGVILTRKGKYDEAIAAFEKVLRLAPDTITAQNNIRKVVAQRDNRNSWVSRLKKFLQADPSQYKVHNDLAAVYYRHKNLEKSAEHLNKSLSLKTNQPDILENLAKVYYEQDKVERAIANWEKALMLKPNRISILNSLAWVRATHQNKMFRDPNQALELAKYSCQLTVFKNGRSLQVLAVSHASVGNFEQAIKTAQLAIDQANLAENKNAVAEIKKYLKFFHAGKPYRQ